MTDLPHTPPQESPQGAPHGAPLLLDDATFGTIARFVPVAGSTTAADWVEIAALAQDLADGNVYLAEGAVLELRGVHDQQELLARVSAPGLLAGTRPVLASPLSPAARAVARDIAAVVESLDAAANLRLGVDGGYGDILHEGLDFGAMLEGENSARLIKGGALDKDVFSIEELVPALVQALEESDTLSATTAQGAGEAQHDRGAFEGERPALPIGWLAEHTREGIVDLGAGLHKGIIPAEFADLIGRLDAPITVTPWQGLIFHDIAEGDAEVVLRVLAPRGFIFDINSPDLYSF